MNYLLQLHWRIAKLYAMIIKGLFFMYMLLIIKYLKICIYQMRS